MEKAPAAGAAHRPAMHAARQQHRPVPRVGLGGVALDVNNLRMSCNARLRVLIARCVCCVTNPCVIWLEGPDLEICLPGLWTALS